MKPAAWMPFYVRDYLADTTHLSTLQHGAYLLLLAAAWTRGGRLPDDNEELANITRLSVTDWSKVRGKILPFFQVEDGFLIQKRLAAEYERSCLMYKQKVENGKKGGRKPKKTEPAGSIPVTPSDDPTDDQTAIPPGIPKAPLAKTQPQPQPQALSLPSEERAQRALEAVMAMRQAGMGNLNPSHPDLLDVIDAGVLPSELYDLTREIFNDKGAKPMAYVMAVAKGRLQARATVRPQGDKHAERDHVLAELTGGSGHVIDVSAA